MADGAQQGIGSLGPVKAWCMAGGALVGIILPLLCMIFPKQQKWIPSAAGIGLAWTFQWYYSLMFFLGAVIGYGFEKIVSRDSRKNTRFPWRQVSSPAAR